MADESGPLFSPASVYWRVNREWLIALAGPRAVLLELAHPAVAAGVAHHSNYRTDPFGRLYRTMKTMTEISFGTASERQIALSHFHRCHARVRSSKILTDDACAHAYDARDPHLQLWVWATLVDSVPLAYERFVAPLSPTDRADYYRDCVRLAMLLGIPASILPPNIGAFHRYFDAMVASETLHVTDAARDIVHALYTSPVRGRLTWRFSFASVGMLPERICREYGYRWDAAREQKLERLAAMTRRVRPVVPDFLAAHPKAVGMERKLKTCLNGKWE